LAIAIVTTGNSAHAQQPAQTLHNHLPHEVSAGQAAVVDSLPPEQQINLSIVLPLRNQKELTSLLGRLYDPSSPDYRRFLSVAQFTEQFGPAVEDYQAVVSFAQAHGFVVSGAPANRLVVPVRGSVDQISKAFHLTMNVYRHPTEDRTFFSPDREPSLDLAVQVAHIAGLNNFSIPHPMLKRSQEALQAASVTGTGPSGSYLGSDMRAAYYGGTALDGNGQSVGILEFGGYDLADVTQTFSNVGQSYNVAINNVLLDGADGKADGYDDAEQVLDIVQAIGMAPGLSQVRVYIGEGLDDANILNTMASENIAKQLSCSWGWRPDDPGTDDAFFEEFAAQGQSFFVASGDSGAFDSVISPFFYPGEDDNVTAVGGTHLTTNGPGGTWASETAWNSMGYGSGGGISPDGIAIPSWQAGVATSVNGGSTTERNVPDVAMEGDFDNYACALGTCETNFAGTSFAAPRWAGFMALVNQQAVEAGNAPNGGVGFLNPALYAIGKGTNYSKDFHDITVGNNDTGNQPVWYSAVSGYDLVTGWGSATGQDLIDDLAGKQVPGFWIEASSPAIAVTQGKSASTTIAVTGADGFSGSVSLALTSALPSGVTASWGTNPTSGTSVLTLKASATASAGTTTLSITGTSGKLTATTKITVVVHAPTFTLASSPSALQVNPGSSVTSTITLTPEYGFTGNANLSISGLPSGVTASWGTNPTSGTSVLTLKASASAAGGTSTLTITGTSGNLTITTSLSLLVAAPTFTLFGPSSLNIGQGSSTSTYISVNPEYGFTGNVSLAVSGLPTGVTASFSPNPTAGNSQLVLTASSAASLGTKTLTITGTSGSVKASTKFTLGVFAPTFTILGPGSVSLGQGTSITSSVDVNQEYGFTGSVSFSASGLPSGVTASFTPNPTTGFSTLTLTASSSVALGTTAVTITGTSGKLTATTTISLGIYTPTFTLSSSGSINIGQGTSNTTYVSINPEYGFTGNVSLSVSGLPSGVTASFSPNPATGYTTLTLTASSTASLGTKVLTITGTSGSRKVTTPLTLGVFAQNFTLSSPGNTTIGQGTSSTVSFAVNPEYGFTGSVNLAVSGLPSGVTASLSPNPSTGWATLTLTADTTTSLGAHTVTITGSSGKLSATTSFSLTTYAPTFTLSNTGNVSVGQGTSGTTYIYVNSEYGFTGSVNLAVSGLPSGVTASFSPNPTNGSAILTLTASSSAVIGNKTLTITGTYGTQRASTTVLLSVYAPAFTLSSPGNMTVGQGTSNTTYFYINPEYGFTGTVNLAVSGLPSGITASLSPNPTTGQAILTLTASSTATLGTNTLTITGTSGTQKASTTFSLSIYAPAFTLSSPGNMTVGQGTSSTTYFYINPEYGFTGSVNLAVSGLPTGVTASFSPNPTTGQGILTLTASSTAALGTKTLTITGTSGTQKASTTFSLSVYVPTFTLNSPGSAVLAPGTSTTSYLYLNPEYGFTGSVKLAVSGLPAGVTASFSPNPTTGQATLTLTASSTATLGTNTLTITGTSGAQTASTTLSLSVAQPTFTLYDSDQVSISQGSSGSSYIYVNSANGFTENVKFAVSGLPSGVTATFSPNPTTGNTQLTLKASSTATLGQKTLTITGTSGTQSATTTLSLAIYAPSFTISAYGGPTLSLGGSATTYVYVNSEYGFSGNVKLAVSGLPSGVTASFSPNPTVNGNSALTLYASSSASLGEYNLTVTGTSGGQTESTILPVTVSAPSFTLYGPSEINVGRGTSSTSYIYVSPQNGFTGSVSFAISGLPSGVTASFSPNPTTGSTVLTLTASSTASLGQYTVTLIGTSGTLTVSNVFSLGIYKPAFTLSSDWSVGIGQGTSVTSYVYVNSQYGFTGSVNLAVSGLPSGVTASFSPNPTATGISVLTLQANSAASPGQYNVVIKGTSVGQTASTTFPLTIYAPTFVVSGPWDLTIGRGTSVASYVYINSQYGFTGSVQFAVSGLPSGVTASFSPNPTSTGTSVLTLKASSSASLGQCTLTLTATSGSQTSSTTFSLAVYAPTFTLNAPGSVVLGQGTSTTTYTQINPEYGFTGNVTLAVSGLPTGVTASFSPNPTTGNSILTLKANSTASLGQYNVTVTGTSGTQVVSTNFPLSIYVPTFTLSSSWVYLSQGASGASYMQVNPQYGFTGKVTLVASHLPIGVTASFSPNPTTGYTTLTLKASGAVSPGQYSSTITGTSGTQTASAPLTLSVSPAPVATLSPASLTFPSTVLGVVSAPQSVTLTNSGAQALSVNGFTFSGTNLKEFEVYGKTCSTSLAPGASCTLQIAFKPTVAGTASANLITRDNASNSPQTVGLSGTGLTPTATVSPASLTFSPQP
jgi:uncharacterized membrane protein